MTQGTYHFQIGTIRCIVFASAREPLTESLVENIFVNDTERMVAAFREQIEPQEFCQNILYLETNGRRVLVDTGEGENVPEKPGQLLNLMRAEGIDPASIDTILLTHFHIDHIGGLLDAQGKKMFPNARIVTSRSEVAYFTKESVLASLKPPRPRIIRETLAAYPPEFKSAQQDIEPGIRLMIATGHTPGHSAVLVESQGEHFMHIVDAAHMTLQLNATDAVPRFDFHAKGAILMRELLFRRAVRKNLLVMAYHFPFPGLGYIQRDENKRYIWIPYDSNLLLDPLVTS